MSTFRLAFAAGLIALNAIGVSWAKAGSPLTFTTAELNTNAKPHISAEATNKIAREELARSNTSDSNFHRCVTQELPAALRRFVIANGPERLVRADESAKAEVVDILFSMCRQRAADSSQPAEDRSYVDGIVGSVFKEIPGMVESQRQTEQLWNSDPNKAIEDQAVRAYNLCLEGSARRLARTSGDPADAIEQRSLAACEKGRQTVFDTYSSHGKSYEPEAMQALEREFHRKLPDVMMRTRDDARKARQQ